MSGVYHNAFEGLPTYSSHTPKEDRRVPGYGGHVPGLQGTCGRTFASATAEVEATGTGTTAFGSTILLRNQIEAKQLAGEEDVGIPNPPPPSKIIVGYGGHKPGMKQAVARTFGSYSLQSYHGFTEAAKTCPNRKPGKRSHQSAAPVSLLGLPSQSQLAAAARERALKPTQNPGSPVEDPLRYAPGDHRPLKYNDWVTLVPQCGLHKPRALPHYEPHEDGPAAASKRPADTVIPEPCVAILGSTGNVGTATCVALSRAGVRTRAGCRSPDGETAQRIATLQGVEVVRADMSQPATLPDAVVGSSAVLIVAPPTEDCARLVGNAVEAALAAGAHPVVQLGLYGLKPDSEFRHIFRQLQETCPLDRCTLLLPVLFYENFLGQAASMQAEGIFFGVVEPDVAVPMVAVQDIADAATTILQDPTPHTGKSYVLVGSHVSMDNVASALSGAVGAAIEYQPVPEAHLGAAVGQQALDDVPKHVLQGGFEFLRDCGSNAGWVKELSPRALGTLLGREPTSMGQWASAIATLLR